MDWVTILEFLKALGSGASYVIMGLGTLVVLGTGYVKLSKTQKDDAWLAKQEAKPLIGGLLKAIRSFSLFIRKDDADSSLKK